LNHKPEITDDDACFLFLSHAFSGLGSFSELGSKINEGIFAPIAQGFDRLGAAVVDWLQTVST
jgi:hypothetical protein